MNITMLKSMVVPTWVKWLAIVVLGAALYGAGRLHEARRSAGQLADFQAKQHVKTIRVIEKQVQVVTKVDVQYRDRIKRIYIQGAAIETNIPTYIQPVDLDRFGVNAGFVRVLDAAWAGAPPGPAAGTDREPAGIPLDDVAAVQVHNATSCLAWREQALGWREFYAGQQVAINGKAGAWAAGAR